MLHAFALMRFALPALRVPSLLERDEITRSRIRECEAARGNRSLSSMATRIEQRRNPRYTSRMTNFLWRTLVVFHRYLGIAVGILMLVWFASGIVMMYVGFPRLTEQERVSALAPIPWQACCRVADGLIPDDLQFYRVQIENLLGVPVLRLRRPPRPDGVIDLAQGVGVRRFDMADARAIALDTIARTAGPATVASAATIDEDQWTVGRYPRDRPLARFTV